MRRLAEDTLSRAPQWLTRPHWKSCGHALMRENVWQRKRVLYSIVKVLCRYCTVRLSHHKLFFKSLFQHFDLCCCHFSHTRSLHLLICTETHTQTHLYAQVFLFSIGPHQHYSLSRWHDRSLGWPPVLIRESVISSAQSLTTHQRNTVWLKLTLTPNVGRTSLHAVCFFGKWEWTR